MTSYRSSWLLKAVLAFGIALMLNIAWEFLHAQLYYLPNGNPITSLRLLRASIFDACYVAIIYLLWSGFRSTLNKVSLYVILVIVGLVFAASLEVWALATGRWAYQASMPLVPVLHVGWLPFVQLASTSLFTIWLTHTIHRRTSI